MMRPITYAPYSQQRDGRAAVFVDYENLYGLLHARMSNQAHPDEYIADLLEKLNRYLLDAEMRTVLVSAFADFGALRNDGLYVQRSLAQKGIIPRYVSSTPQANASEIQLCVEVMDVLQQRPDVQTFVLLTGDRAYLPLVQQIRRQGCNALVVCVVPPSALEDLPEKETFVEVVELLGDSSSASERHLFSGAASNGSNGTAYTANPRGAGSSYATITDPTAHRTLEIIEEHFGQYDEVYLTPLLRKLTEALGEDGHDPKSIISELEAAGAVWLEKRRGYPYDYTVLIVDSEHPDVEQVQKNYYARQETRDVSLYEDDDRYDDEGPEAYAHQNGEYPDEPGHYEDEDWEDNPR